MIIKAVMSITPYLADKGEHRVLYKINTNVYIKASKIIHYMAMILYMYNNYMFVLTSLYDLCVCQTDTEFAVLTGRSVSCVSAMSMFEEGKVAKADAAENDANKNGVSDSSHHSTSRPGQGDRLTSTCLLYTSPSQRDA